MIVRYLLLYFISPCQMVYSFCMPGLKITIHLFYCTFMMFKCMKVVIFSVSFSLCRGAVWCALGVPVQRQLSGLSVAEWESSPPPPPGGATEHNVSHGEDRNPRTGWGDLPECPPKSFISNSFWFLLISTLWLKKYKKSIPIEVVWLQHCSKYLLMSSSEESKSYILSGVS